ncbi:unnamed protein product [Brugia pahangi]|uniref:Uncharacterized protein n=1 Tax=Brugia pahangi TaxID=6280 RepID=A0A0N4T888_BRUPA|nr:unnamed protein product [Brugia pahangi]
MDVGTTLGPVVTPGAPSTAATAMIFPGQSGPMPALPDLTGRGQNNVSPRGARGGRRKAAGLSTRSQGTTTRKQRQQRQQTVDQLAVAAAAAAAAAQQQQQQMGSAVGCGGGHLSSLYTRAPGLLAHSKQVIAMGTQTTEDSKMKIHSMILQKRQAQAASGATATQQV